MGTPAVMMKNLGEMFGHQNWAARQNAMRVLMTTQMLEGTLIRDHVPKMISHLNELDILGATIDAKTQVDIILGSSPMRFEQFRINYNVNLREYTLPELLIELQTAEGFFRQGYQVLATTSVLTSNPKWKKKKQMGQKQVTTLKVKSKAPHPEANKNQRESATSAVRKEILKRIALLLIKVTKQLRAGEITIN
ncbi:hypothetical protein OROMI_002410 [Orobanche minor]